MGPPCIPSSCSVACNKEVNLSSVLPVEVFMCRGCQHFLVAMSIVVFQCARIYHEYEFMTRIYSSPGDMGRGGLGGRVWGVVV